MSKPKVMKAAVSAIVASMLLANAAWAEEAKSSSAPAKFNDVPGSHWANKHISKLALEGILEGKDTGKFDPDAIVTQEEVIVMAIRLMGLEEEAKEINTTSYVLPEQLAVSSFAKPYMIEAIEKGLITTLEETAIASQDNGKTTWGTRPATREWVTKLTVRAIGRQDDAKSQEGKATSFSDNSAISSWALGYINTAVALKIVDGMPDGSFKPKDSVSRAQMATFLSRAEKSSSVTSDRAMIGTIDQISSTSIKVTDAYGKSNTYALSADTLLFDDEDKAITAAELRSGYEVYVVAAEGKASYVEILNEDSQSETVEGTLEEIRLSDMKLSLNQNGKVILVDLDSAVSVVDKDGKGLSLGQLEKGSWLQLKRTGSNAKYTRVVVKEVPINKTAEGVVQSVDLEGKKLVVTEDGSNVEYRLADSVQFIENNGSGDLTTLVPNDKIRFRVTNSQVVSIEMLVKYVEPSDSGKLTFLQIDGAARYLTIVRADNTPSSYSLIPLVEVVIPGVDYASINDLVLGDQIKVTLNADNAVKKITILNRSVQTTYLNTVVSFDEKEKFLTVVDSSGKPQVYILSEQTLAAEKDDSLKPYSQVSNLFEKGKKLDITANQDREVKQLKVSYWYDGTISRFDPSAGEMDLQLGANQFVTLKLLSDTTVETPRETNAALRTVAKGDKVRALLPSQDYVTQIQLKKSAAFRVTSKDSDNDWVRFRDEYGTEYDETLADTVSIERNGQTGLTVADLPLGELVSVNYRGRTIEKIILSPVTRGKVTSVDAIGGKLSVLDFNGNEQEFDGAASAKVKLPSGPVGSLSDLKLDDRVELIQDSDGKYVIYLAQELERTVQSYDPFKKMLDVKRATLDEQASFEFHSSAYVHRGSEAIVPNFLLENDVVKLYVIDGKIIELDKQ